MIRAVTAFGQAPARAASQTTDLSGLAAILARRWRSIVLITTASVAASILYLLVTPPTYVATASIYIDPRPKKVVTEEPQANGGSGTDLALVESQVAIMRSDAVVSRVVDKLKLATDPDFASPPRGLTTAIKRSLGIPVPTQEPAVQAAEALARLITVKRAQKSYVVDVEVTSGSPVKAARLTQAVVDAYLADQANAKSDDAQRANALIEGRLGQLREQVRRAETAVDEFRKTNRLLSSEGGTIGEQQLTKLNTELVAARSNAAEAKARYDEALAAARSGNADVITDPAKTGLLQRLREQLALVSRREASLASQLLPKHPVLIDIRSQVADIKGQISAELKRLAANAKADHLVAEARERELVKVLETTKLEVSRTNTAQIKQRELEQEVATSRELMRTFLTRSKETEEQQKISTPDARLISPPSVPNKPAKPVIPLILGLGLLGGIAAGIARALIADQIDGRLRSSAAVETRTGLRTIAAIPPLKPRQRTVIPLRGRGEQSPIETSAFGGIARAIAATQGADEFAYRRAVLGLLSRLHAEAPADAAHTVMFAAATQAKAASAIAFAVAYAAAANGERVLLVDAASATTALSDGIVPVLPERAPVALDRSEDLAAIISQDPHTGLSVLPIALADLRSLKPAQRTRLHTGLAALSQAYDLVVIDAGGLAGDDSADAVLPIVHDAILVADAAEDDASQLKAASQQLGHARDGILGVVLANADPAQA